MTQDERNGFIELAKQVGMIRDGEVWFSPSYENCDVYTADLLFFAKLVAEKEREACALIADQISNNTTIHVLEKYSASEIAKSIRARGDV